MMTPSKQRKFAFSCLLKAIKEVSVWFLTYVCQFSLPSQGFWVISQVKSLSLISIADINCDMRFPTMWYVRLAKPQIKLRICAD